MKKGAAVWAGLILIGLFFLACAGSRTYLLNVYYDGSGTPKFLEDPSRPVTIAVYQFEDLRPERLYLGRRVYRDGKVDYYKPDGGTVDQVVTQNIVRTMERAGFKVVMVNRPLNPDKEDFRSIPGQAALGGKIETLWVEAKSGYTTTDTDARLRLQVIWGLPKERGWITRIIEGSSQESDRPLYRPKYAEAKINDVFKDGLDKMLRDEPQLREKLIKNQ